MCCVPRSTHGTRAAQAVLRRLFKGPADLHVIEAAIDPFVAHRLLLFVRMPAHQPPAICCEDHFSRSFRTIDLHEVSLAEGLHALGRFAQFQARLSDCAA